MIFSSVFFCIWGFASHASTPVNRKNMLRKTVYHQLVPQINEPKRRKDKCWKREWVDPQKGNEVINKRCFRSSSMLKNPPLVFGLWQRANWSRFQKSDHEFISMQSISNIALYLRVEKNTEWNEEVNKELEAECN